ncbi:response regulator transcription factor [Phycisphaerales bacterium AB-hyl4]|uniref:Response regulator transcription factor n=1 Tax=Natronomicrosphaera hydrolytica TaxID=3242702 RepID=A0ABV4U2U1_9BACT
MTAARFAVDSSYLSGRTAIIRVLLADDHKIMRQGLMSLLEDEPDIKVVAEANDGQEAVEQALQHTPDVVIMDISMPRLNGIEATRQIVSKLPHISVIGLSMHEDAEMAEAIRRAGAKYYLSKGGPADQLVATIRRAM